MKKLRKDSMQLLVTLRDLCLQTSQIMDDFSAIYDNTAPNYNSYIRAQEIAKQMEVNRVNFDEALKKNFIDPFTTYMDQFTVIEQRIAQRQVRLVDMDRYGRDLRALSEKGKDPTKVRHAEQKHDAAVANYRSLNDELLRDMPRLYNDRVPFCDPVFASLLNGLSQFYTSNSRTTSDMTSLVSRINSESIHSHQWVITPADASAMRTKSSVGTNSFYAPEGGAPPMAIANQPHNSGPSNPIPPSNQTYNNAQQSYPQQSYHSGVEFDPNGPDYATPQLYPSVPQPTAPSANGRNLPVPPKAKSNVKRAKALFDFTASEANELGFKVNDIIIIHNTNGDWWEGELSGKKGILPSNYVQLL
eukprot:TRINITY_DN13570_c0_g1_i1.p1 TRINITY_DN13570_c0_g1~~TRINITY_DN13570_c0_g1_i1.p1  ORF type:complete len:399 (-),score=106.16 TRINITY_DN13570_c0_g1_i1:64-1140(-)